jgi:uncharacterized membrane protein YbhN (UPF0104 family)
VVAARSPGKPGPGGHNLEDVIDLNNPEQAQPAAGRFSPGFGNLVAFLIFIAFVIFVEFYFGWARLIAPWARLSPLKILLAAVVVFVSYAVRTLRIYHYFREEMRGAYVLCLKLFLQHNVLNNLLPMRSGELSFPMLMSRYFNIRPVRSLPTLLWFRLLDLHTLLVIALFVTLDSAPRVLLLGAVVLCLPLPYVGYLISGRLLRWLEVRPSGKLRSLLIKVLMSLPQSSQAFWITWLWTVVNWVAKLAAFAWVLSLFIDVSAVGAWFGVIAGDLTSVLPVHSVAGAGTFEAGVVAALLPFVASADGALQAAVNLHLFLLGAAILGGLVSLVLPTRRVSL